MRRDVDRILQSTELGALGRTRGTVFQVVGLNHRLVIDQLGQIRVLVVADPGGVQGQAQTQGVVSVPQLVIGIGPHQIGTHGVLMGSGMDHAGVDIVGVRVARVLGGGPPSGRAGADPGISAVGARGTTGPIQGTMADLVGTAIVVLHIAVRRGLVGAAVIEVAADEVAILQLMVKFAIQQKQVVHRVVRPGIGLAGCGQHVGGQCARAIQNVVGQGHRNLGLGVVIVPAGLPIQLLHLGEGILPEPVLDIFIARDKEVAVSIQIGPPCFKTQGPPMK